MINIFVSSTFSDMHAERDAIQMLVLPAIRKKAKLAGESFDFCDLRWGINTRDADESKRMGIVLETCFREIKRCKPYMIVLLGERYGSRPNKDRLDEILSIMNADNETHFTGADIKDKSYTELEVHYGPLSDDEQFRRTIFLFRGHINGAPHEFDGTQEDLKKIEDLKELIEDRGRKLGINNVIKYSLGWDNSAGKVIGIENFVNLLSSKIEEMLSPAFEKIAALTPLEKTLRRQWMYFDKKAKCFSGFNDLLERSESILREKKELIICGSEGSGKSCLLSKLAQIKRETCNVFPYVCEQGVTKEEICAEWVVYLNDKLKNNSAYMQGEQPTENTSDVCYKLNNLLDAYDSDESLPPLYFFVDSTENIKHEIGWDFRMAEPLYSKILFIYSHKIDKDIFNDNGIFLESSQTDTGEIINGNMSAYGKFLPAEIVNGVVEKYGGSKPVVISLLFRRLSLLNATDFVGGTGVENQLKIYRNILEKSSVSEDELFKNLISVIAERTDAQFINAVVGYLVASFFGLRRSDLQNLLTADGIVWDNAYYSVLVDYLDEIFYENAEGCVDFEHRSLKEKLVEETDVGKYRKRILHYLKDLPAEDSFREENIFKYCHYFKDGKYLVQVLQNEYNKSSRFVHSMGFDVGWLKELFDNDDKYGVDIRAVRFINNVFSRNLIMGTKSTTAEILRSVLWFLDRYSGEKDIQDVAITKYHLERLGELFDDNNGAYARLSYLEKIEGNEFVNTLYNYICRIQAGNSSACMDEFRSFIDQSKNKVDPIALAYLYVLFAKCNGTASQNSKFYEKSLSLFANEQYVDGVFTDLAISAIDCLCGNELWAGEISDLGLEKFERSADLIQNVVKAFSNGHMYCFYLNSCTDIAKYCLKKGDGAKAEKYVKLIYDKILNGEVFNSKARYDLLNLSIIGNKTAIISTEAGNYEMAVKLYEYSIDAMTTYYVRYKVPKPQLPEETFIKLNGSARFIQPRLIIADDYMGMAEIYYTENEYEDCLTVLTNAILILDAYLNNSDGLDIEAAKEASRALDVFNKLIKADLIKTDKLTELLAYASGICDECNMTQYFALDLPDFKYYFNSIASNAVRSCKRQKNYIAEIELGKLYNIEPDTSVMFGREDSAEGINIFDTFANYFFSELSEKSEFVQNCLKALSPQNQYVDISEKFATTITMLELAKRGERNRALKYRKAALNVLSKRFVRINGKKFVSVIVEVPINSFIILNSIVNYDRDDFDKNSGEWNDDWRHTALGNLVCGFIGLADCYIKQKNYPEALRQCDNAREYLKQRNGALDELLEAIILNLRGLCSEAMGGTESYKYFNRAVEIVEKVFKENGGIITAKDCLSVMLFNKSNSSSVPEDYGDEKRAEELARVGSYAAELYALTNMRYYNTIKSMSKETNGK